MHKRPIRDIDSKELAQWLEKQGQPRFRGRQIEEWFSNKLIVSFDEMANIPATLRSKLAEAFLPCAVEPIEKLCAEDHTVKWLSKLADDATVETVLIRAPGRNTVCISTQVGCAVRCVFCESGRLGFVRNLTATEIIDQVILASHEAGKLVDNVVVMGTGEPMHNLDNLIQALNWLCDQEKGMGMSARHITVSTSGITKGIKRLADLKRPWNLAVSLHAPNDRLRAQIIPPRHRRPIAEIVEACKYYRESTGRMVTFEYVLVKGTNDSESEARELAAVARDTRAKVNLIPCNDGASKLRAPERIACEKFLKILEQHGVQATIRHRKGDDIMAACGQLRANREKARTAASAANKPSGD